MVRRVGGGVVLAALKYATVTRYCWSYPLTCALLYPVTQPCRSLSFPLSAVDTKPHKDESNTTKAKELLLDRVGT